MIPLMIRTEMVLETSVYSSFNHLTQLLVQENFIELTKKFSIQRLGCILLPLGRLVGPCSSVLQIQARNWAFIC